jgi:hypothetical protein
MLKLLETPVNFQRVAAQSLLALFQGRLHPVQASQRRLMLGLAFLQGLAFFDDLQLTGLRLGQRAGNVAAELLVAHGDLSLLLVKPCPFAGQLLGPGIELGLADCVFLTANGQGAGFDIDLGLAFLHLSRGPADSLVQPRQAIAALAVTVVELLAEVGQLAVCGRRRQRSETHGWHSVRGGRSRQLGNLYVQLDGSEGDAIAVVQALDAGGLVVHEKRPNRSKLSQLNAVGPSRQQTAHGRQRGTG